MADEEGYIDVSFAKDGGVMKKIIKEAPEGASGPPPNGNEVEAHYTGTKHSKWPRQFFVCEKQQLTELYRVQIRSRNLGQ